MPDDSGGGSQNKKTSFIHKLFKPKGKESEQQQTEEEILSLVEEGTEKGVIRDTTQSIIENIFDFDDTTAVEIMTHRTELAAVADTDSISVAVDIAIKSGHSRIPVYHEDIDNIVGVLYVKDLLKFVGKKLPDNLTIPSIMRDALFIPKTKNCSRLFAEMTKKKIQLAIIVDDYGGTEGIVTLEDLIEEILGNIQDEYDNEDEDIHKLGEGKFTVDGATPIEDICDLIGCELPESDCDTVAGFILEQLEHIPTRSEKPAVVVNNIRFIPIKIEDRRITKVLIEKL